MIRLQPPRSKFQAHRPGGQQIRSRLFSSQIAEIIIPADVRMRGFFTEGKMADSADNIQTYRQMLKLDRRSRVFALLAEELCAAGQWEEAAEVCKKGLLFYPDHLRSRVLLGWALMEMGEADQSERILLNAVEDIRKNAIIFKLLSEFAAFSGNTQERRRICQDLRGCSRPRTRPGANLAPPEIDHIEPEGPPEKEVSEWDNFKEEAIEELHGAEAWKSLRSLCTEHRSGTEDRV